MGIILGNCDFPESWNPSKQGRQAKILHRLCSHRTRSLIINLFGSIINYLMLAANTKPEQQDYACESSILHLSASSSLQETYVAVHVNFISGNQITESAPSLDDDYYKQSFFSLPYLRDLSGACAFMLSHSAFVSLD